MKRIILLCVLLLFSGCEPLWMQQQDRADFAAVNANRQAHGLPPLTWAEFKHPEENPTPAGNGTEQVNANLTVTQKP
jgi:hypothetical protein